MSKLYKKSIHKLELNIVLEKLASCADSHVAKEACRNLEPVSDLDSVRHLLEQTNAALQLCLTNGNPNFSDTKDVSESLERADLGGCLQPKELLTIAALLNPAVSGYSGKIRRVFTGGASNASKTGEVILYPIKSPETAP